MLTLSLGATAIVAPAASAAQAVSVTPVVPGAAAIDPGRLAEAIGTAQQNIRDLKMPRTGPNGESFEYWDRPSRLGLHYSSQYYLILKWLAYAGLSRGTFDANKTATLKNLIMKTRLPDGSWYAIKDTNLLQTSKFADLSGLKYDDIRSLSRAELDARGIVSFNPESVTHYRGDLNASIFHYWALKVMGADSRDKDLGAGPSPEQMADSRNFILRQGGIDRSVLFTKVLLALFGDYPWQFIPYIPMSMFYDFPRQHLVKDFSQWVIPHLKPMAYLIHYGNAGGITPKNLPPAFALNELYVNNGRPVRPRADFLPGVADRVLKRLGKSDRADRYLKYTKNLVENVLLKEQKKHGSWGAYTLSTLFTIIVLNDYSQGKANRGISVSDAQRAAIRSKMERGFGFIEKLFFASGESSYFGVLDDGSYWDTALLALALLETGENPESLRKVGDFLASLQQQDGGFPFGYDFDTYTDVDDSATILQMLSYLPGYEQVKRRGLRYFLNMQNRDGGWAAFDRDNTGNALIRFGSKQTADSADLFDESSPDVTGHVLSYLGLNGMTAKNKEVMGGALYLRKTAGQATQGGTRFPGIWDSRWAINFFFGTESAVSGFKSVGFPASHPIFGGVREWIMPRDPRRALQNPDGGFGESSASYWAPEFIGRGVSTATQTAWALSILSELEAYDSKEAIGAVNFLIGQIEADRKFSDPSVTGTGHPNVIYMEYASYPMSFPLIALGKYLRGACAPGVRERVFGGAGASHQGANENRLMSLCSRYLKPNRRYVQ